MENENFYNSKAKLFSFIDAVNDEKQSKDIEDKRKSTTEYKLKTLDQCENDAKEICLDRIFSKVYKDAVPFNDQYKIANAKNIDGYFHIFMQKRCPNGLEFYVKEALKKGSPYAKKVLEAVDELINNEYHDKALNIDNVKAEDLKFNPDAPEVAKNLSEIDITLSSPEISDAIKTNVLHTVKNNILRAKSEKENIKNIEAELAKNIEVTTAEAVELELTKRGLDKPIDFTPSLFEAININKYNELQTRYESGEDLSEYLYGTMEVFTDDPTTENSDDVDFASMDQLAFIESVKEFTAITMLHTMGFEPLVFPSDVNDLAFKYAHGEI